MSHLWPFIDPQKEAEVLSLAKEAFAAWHTNTIADLCSKLGLALHPAARAEQWRQRRDAGCSPN